MSADLDRRTCLQGLAAVAAVPLSGLRTTAQQRDVTVPATARGERSVGNRVIVLGAGLAGLASGYRLVQRGYDVVVLEAQDRPGGRVQTARAPFRRGGHAELGALRIFETHEHTLRYVNEFGLELTPYDAGPRAFYLQGRRFLAPAPGEAWPLDGLAPGEQPDPAARIPHCLLSGFEKLGDIFDPGWPGGFPSAVELDRTTLGDYMRAQGASETWLDWFFAQEGRTDPVNAAAALATEAVNSGSTVQSIKGGNDLLPKALAAALGARVKFASPVVRIDQDRHGVTVGYRHRHRLHQLRADRCVCALPFSPLRRVALRGTLSDRKMDAIERLKYMAAAAATSKLGRRSGSRTHWGRSVASTSSAPTPWLAASGTPPPNRPTRRPGCCRRTCSTPKRLSSRRTAHAESRRCDACSARCCPACGTRSSLPPTRLARGPVGGRGVGLDTTR